MKGLSFTYCKEGDSVYSLVHGEGVVRSKIISELEDDGYVICEFKCYMPEASFLNLHIVNFILMVE